LKGLENHIRAALCLLLCFLFCLDGCREPSSETPETQGTQASSEPGTQEGESGMVPSDQPSQLDEVQIRQMRVAWRELAKIYGKELPPAAIERSRKDALAQIEKAREELRQGGDWNEVATRYSDTAPVPGGITLTRDGAIPAPLKEGAFGLTVGKTDLVETSYGWHLIERLP
jgi:hypothetical protein